jgi:hypothetical protein
MQKTVNSNKKYNKKVYTKKKSLLKNSRLINKYKVIKFLGQGVTGKVYLVSKNNVKYAMKVVYITSHNDSFLQTEIKFLETIGKQNPDQFTQLIDYEIVDNCNDVFPDIPEWMTDSERTYFTKLHSAKICVKKIYSLVDTTLSNINLKKLNLNQKYSIIIQILYIVYLFQQGNYNHGDLHSSNIGVLYVNKQKTINIFGKKIPTYGIQLQVIDYDGILQYDTMSSTKSYQQWANTTEKEHYVGRNILDKILICIVVTNSRKYWQFVQENNIKLKGLEKDSKKIFNQKNEMKIINEMTNNDIIKFNLFEFLFTAKFQKVILGKNFINILPIEYYIPREDILFSYINYNNTELLINYYINKLTPVIILLD